MSNLQVIDNVSKRVAFSWTLIFLLGWFLSNLAYHVVNIRTSLSQGKQLSHIRDYTLFIQWFFIFSAFTFSVYCLQIPRLKFRFPLFCGYVIAIAGFLMVIILPASPVSVRNIFERFQVKSTYNDHEHDIVKINFGENKEEFAGSISGSSVTLDVLPYSSAEFAQVEMLSRCISLNQIFYHSRNLTLMEKLSREFPTEYSDTGFFVSVIVKGVPPWVLEYEVHDYLRKTTVLKQIVIQDESLEMNRMSNTGRPSKTKVFKLETNFVGSYSLVSLKDEKGDGVILGERTVVLEACPESELLLESSAQTKCLTDFSDLIQGFAFGIGPLTVDYEVEKPNGFKQAFSIQVDSLHGNLEVGKSKTYKFTVPGFELESIGIYTIRLIQTTDGHGLITKYLQELGGLRDQKIHVLNQPVVYVKQANYEVFDFLPSFSVPISVHLSGPNKRSFEIKYRYEINDTVDVKTISDQYEILVNNAGDYTIESIFDRACGKPTFLSTKNNFRVVKMQPPSVEVDQVEIIDEENSPSSCVNFRKFDTDMRFSIRSTGRGPWKLKYEIRRGSKLVKSSVLSLKSPKEMVTISSSIEDDILEDTDSSKVEYQVKFTEFNDDQYPKTVFLDDLDYRKVIYKPIIAKVELMDVQLCLGSRAKIRIKVSNNFGGNQLLSVDFDLINTRTNSKIPVLIENLSPVVNSPDVYEFETAILNEGGVYSAIFNKISYSNSNCALQIFSFKDEISVPIRKVRVSLLQNEFMSIDIEEIVSIPIRIDDVFKYPVVLRLRLADGTERELRFTSQEKPFFSMKIPNIPGNYSIIDVKDDLCQGTLQDELNFTIKYYKRPSIEIQEGYYGINNTSNNDLYILPSRSESSLFNSCLDEQERFIKISLTGERPFEVKYKMNGRLNVKNNNNDILYIHLPLNTPGEHKITFISISDKRYRDVQLGEVSRQYHVFESPRLYFDGEKTKNVSICQGNSVGNFKSIEGEFPTLVYEGKSFPLEISYSVRDLKKSIIINSSIELKVNKFLEGIVVNQTGVFLLKLHSVLDANGCLFKSSGKESEVTISVLNPPSFYPSESKENICVDDYIHFEVEGIPDYEVYYEFKDINGQISNDVLPVKIRNSPTKSSNAWFLDSIFNSHKEPRKEKEDEVIPSKKQVQMSIKQPGELLMKKLCHRIDLTEPTRESSCCMELNQLFKIRAMPKAKVLSGSGSTKVSIREGGETTMNVEFISGSPPFSFSFVRKNDLGIDLETQTITDIKTRFYQLPLSQPGKYEVIRISDKYCEFTK